MYVDLAVVSLALRAALGEPVDTSSLMMHAVVAGGLVDLLRSLPVTLSGHPIDLPWSCVVRLESLLAYIGEHDLHVVLLDNIAYINRTDDYERGPIATNAP